MPSIRVNQENNTGIHFVTFTVKKWYYLFDRHNRWDILLNSLKYCQKNKELKIYTYVFMLNHLHLIVQNDDLSGFIRDFKRFTSKELRKNITETEPNVLDLFQENEEFIFWKKTNMPEFIENERFFLQKKNYIEENPVKKKYVDKAEYWRYSSANPGQELVLTSIYE